MMNVPYLDENQEGVRQVALKCFQRIYKDIVSDLKDMAPTVYRDALIIKWGEIVE